MGTELPPFVLPSAGTDPLGNMLFLRCKLGALLDATSLLCPVCWKQSLAGMEARYLSKTQWL